jgi:hypothetical protein
LSIGGRPCQIVVHPPVSKNNANLSNTSHPRLSFSCPFRRECFRKLSKAGKGSALRPVGEPRGRGGSVQSCDVGRNRLPGRVVQGIATTATPTKDLSAPDGPPVFPIFQQPDATAGVATGRALQNNHAWFDKLTMREVEDCRGIFCGFCD